MKNLLLTVLFLTSPMIISITDTHAAIQQESIIGIWLLEDGQGEDIEDASVNGHDGKAFNAKWTEGKIGKGLEFDGTSRVVIPANNTTEDYLDGFTYLLWVKPTATPPGNHTRLIERGWHNPTIQIGLNDFYGSIVQNGKQDFSHVRGGEWQLDEWSFVALTHDGNVLKLYVDGEPVVDKTLGKADTTTDAELRFGAYSRAGWDFTGVLDEVGVFNAPLSDSDIKSIMNNGLEETLAVTAAGKLAVTWGHIKKTQF